MSKSRLYRDSGLKFSLAVAFILASTFFGLGGLVTDVLAKPASLIALAFGIVIVAAAYKAGYTIGAKTFGQGNVFLMMKSALKAILDYGRASLRSNYSLAHTGC